MGIFFLQQRETWSYYFIAGADLLELDTPAKDVLQAKAFLENREVIQAIERRGANHSVAYLSSLPVTEQQPLVWLGRSGATAAPEIQVTPLHFDGLTWITDLPWTWKPSLVGVNSSEPGSEDFTLEDGAGEK